MRSKLRLELIVRGKNERRGISYDHKFENIAFILVAKIKYYYTDFFYYKIVIDNF